MKLLVGYYETDLLQNRIKIPEVWVRRLKLTELYCIIEQYTTDRGKASKRIRCFIKSDDRDRICKNNDDVFVIHIDDNEKIHLHSNYIKKCKLKQNQKIYIFGYGQSFYIQSEKEAISEDALKIIQRRFLNEALY